MLPLISDLLAIAFNVIYSTKKKKLFIMHPLNIDKSWKINEC